MAFANSLSGGAILISVDETNGADGAFGDVRDEFATTVHDSHFLGRQLHSPVDIEIHVEG